MSVVNIRKLLLFFWYICIFVTYTAVQPAFPVQDASLMSTGTDSAPAPTSQNVHAFLPGEVLTYTISWSKIISAGTAVMEVKSDATADGSNVLRFVSTARSIGIVDKFYPVRDVVQSVFDPVADESLSYTLDQRHGTRKKNRELIFDHEKERVAYSANGHREFIDIPEHTQDALSSLYSLRMQKHFIEGKTITMNIHDSGKNWSVEIHVLGREKIKTPVGEFDTIKVKTYPKYDGVFMHKGEIFMWLTDDQRKIPVLMKSTITIGSIVATLTDMKTGENVP